MNAENAAGRKTDRFERAARRYEAQLETQLELLTGAMRGSVTRADAVTDETDEYGHCRDSHIGHAVKIGAVSAQIVTALGKLAGEFSHNINVTRAAEAVASGKTGERRKLTDEEWERIRTPFELPRSSSHPPLDRWLKEEYAEQDAMLAAEEAAAASGEAPAFDRPEGAPPPENSGSNG